MELKKVTDNVKWLLSRSEHLRNCDKCLIKAYHWQIDGYRGNLDRDKIHGLTSTESIRRARQLIQNKYHLYTPTDEKVVKKRKSNETLVKEWLSTSGVNDAEE